jgi:cytochrome c553
VGAILTLKGERALLQVHGDDAYTQFDNLNGESSSSSPSSPDGVARCAICHGIVVAGDRLEEDGLVRHPTCLMAARSWQGP